MIFLTDDECREWCSRNGLAVTRGVDDSSPAVRVDLDIRGFATLGASSAIEDDLTTFIQIGILSGWDIHVLPDLAYGRAFMTHEGCVDLWRSNENDLTSVENAFRTIGYQPKVRS